MSKKKRSQSSGEGTFNLFEQQAANGSIMK